MKNAYAKRIKPIQDNATTAGFVCANVLTILAIKNIGDDYFVNDEQRYRFYRELEAEINRIFAERFTGDWQEFVDLIIGHADEERRKAGMGGL